MRVCVCERARVRMYVPTSILGALGVGLPHSALFGAVSNVCTKVTEIAPGFANRVLYLRIKVHE